MASGSCGREDDVIRAAWGASGALEADRDLAAHLAACPACAETAWLARALRQERQVAGAEAQPPSAGLVWWRAQRRARADAARKAAGPVALIHAIALGCTGAAAAAILSLGLGRAESWAAVAGSLFSRAAIEALLSSQPTLLLYGVMLLVLTTLVLAPVAIYLAVREP